MSIIDNTVSSAVILNFNSKDRLGGSNSNFISQPIELGTNKYDSVCLVQASIPKSFYNMPSGYNTFSLTEGGSPTTVTIPVGSYTKTNLQTALTTALNAASVVLGHTYIYTVSYPASSAVDTFKYTFAVTGNAGVQPVFTFTITFSPFRQLGFDDGSVNTFVASSLVSTNAINLSYILRMFIKSNVTLATDGILEEILSVGSYPPLSVVHYQQMDFDMNTRPYDSSHINSWNFSLVDAFDQLVELNGIPWSFSVVFFQRNNTHELHKNELNIQNEQRLFDVMQKQADIKTNLKKKMKSDFLFF